MSVCRSSRQIFRRTQSSIGRQAPCTRLGARPFHSTSAVLDDQPQKPSSTKSTAAQDGQSKRTELTPTPTSKLPPLRSPTQRKADKRRAARADEIKQINEHFQPFSEEEYKAMESFYSPEQIEALKAAEKAISVEDLAEQWGPRLDQWKMEYMDDLSRVDPWADKQPQVEVSDAPEFTERSEKDFIKDQAAKVRHGGLDLVEMLYRIEQDKDLSPKIKAGLRTLHRWKGTHKEFAAREILWRYVSPRSTISTPGQEPIELLFERFEQIPMDPYKKAEVLAFKHWCGTQKEEALRPMLVRAINKQALSGTPFLEILENEELKVEETEATEDQSAFKALISQTETSLQQSFTKDDLKLIYELKQKAPSDFNKPESFETFLKQFPLGEPITPEEQAKVDGIISAFGSTTTPEPTVATLEADANSVSSLPNNHLVPSQRIILQQMERDWEINRRYSVDLEAEGDLWLVNGKFKEIANNPIYSAVAPPIPKFKDPRVLHTGDESDDALEAAYARLAKQMKVGVNEIKQFRVKQLVQHRVVNQTRNGKIQSMYSLSVAGNENGLLGIGEGKAAEMEDAMIQSRVNAIRNMKPIHRYEGRTIYGKINTKVGGTTVEIAARPPGFGLRVQHLVFEVARCAGLRDLSARVGRSRNKMNTVKATAEALLKQKLPEEIARSRGRKLVDVRKVYYGKTLY